MRLILDLFGMKPIWTSDYGYVWCFCAAADAAIFIKYGQDVFVPFQQKSCRWWELGNKAMVRISVTNQWIFAKHRSDLKCFTQDSKQVIQLARANKAIIFQGWTLLVGLITVFKLISLQRPVSFDAKTILVTFTSPLWKKNGIVRNLVGLVRHSHSSCNWYLFWGHKFNA